MKKVQANGTTQPRATRPVQSSPHPIFDALLIEAMRSPREELLRTDEVARERGITQAERAAARVRIAQWEPDEPDNGDDVEVAEDRAAGSVGAHCSPGRSDTAPEQTKGRSRWSG